MIDIRGIFNFSLVDYPGHISCIVFTGGCNFRCPFCHNPCLVLDPGSQPRITEKQLFHFLKQRKGKLEGVVLSGGEPTLQMELGGLVSKIHAEGFLVKVDTNGSSPETVKELIDSKNVSAFGIDYKTPAADYPALTGSQIPGLAEKVQTSISLVLASGLDLDVRTTVHRSLLSPEKLAVMHGELMRLGVKQWTLQQFNPVEVIEDTLDKQPTYSDAELVALARSLGKNVRVRGLGGHILD